MTDIDKAKALMDGVTEGPWSYRPREYDDWGVVRASEADGRHPMICQARNPERLSDDVLSEHRVSGIDPWGPNARFIAATRDLVPALIAEVEVLRAANRGLVRLNEATEARAETAYLEMRNTKDAALAAERERVKRLREAARVRVRPLEWEPSIGGFHTARIAYGGKIEIMWDMSPADGEYYVLYPCTDDRRRFPTLEAAKAAAQADYEARILSALTTPEGDSK